MRVVLFLTSLTVLIVLNLKKSVVLGMIFFGSFIYPEASEILSHYCFGNGEKLTLKSDYIKNSPVVIKHLKKMNIGEKKRITFTQKEDWRLSYALNPFYLEKRANKAVITQYIKFDQTNKSYTKFGSFKIHDNIVHTFECVPFNVYYEFNYK